MKQLNASTRRKKRKLFEKQLIILDRELLECNQQLSVCDNRLFLEKHLPHSRPQGLREHREKVNWFDNILCPSFRPNEMRAGIQDIRCNNLDAFYIAFEKRQSMAEQD
jgi:hypothetical protein